MDAFMVLKNLIDDNSEYDDYYGNNFNQSFLELNKFYEELSEGKYIKVDSDSIGHCYNCGSYRSSCKYIHFYQQGGGSSSPVFSYISCRKTNRRILFDPLIPNSQSKIKSMFIPLNCIHYR